AKGKAADRPRLPGYTKESRQVRRRDDLMVRLTPDAIGTLYRVIYQIPGESSARQVGVAYSHGVCVVGKQFPVAAHDLVVGDELVRAETNVPPAKVLAVRLEECSPGKEWQVLHPNLARGTWVQGGGVLLHTDQGIGAPPGVVKGSRVAVTTVAPEMKSHW